MNILVVRFRQMGDAILATALLNTLRANFLNARIDFVLNERLATLFVGHPSIDHVITFSEDERHNLWRYLKKVWRVVHTTRYDVIVDMRSTVNTLPFTLFSLSTRYRIGVSKPYTRLVFNYPMEPCGERSMVDYNVHLASPLETLQPIQYVQRFTLSSTEKEISAFRDYMKSHGLDMSRKVLLVSIATRVPAKMWSEDGTVWVLCRLLEAYPDLQIIFNYAPGREEEQMRRVYERMGKPKQVFMDIQAKSPRELMAMCANVSMFFGNEGGARHIAHAMGVPSLVICAPTSCRTIWIPQNDVPAEAIDPYDMVEPEVYAGLTYTEQYALVTREEVWRRLKQFVSANLMD